jgi:large subunit ribosomal protein L15
MRLNELKPARGSRKARKRVGRGNGSGHGNFSCRGVKGQRARAGGKRQLPGFEGGQTPFWKKLPKRGFSNFTRKSYAWVNLGSLEARFQAGDEVTPEVLRQVRLVRQMGDGVKVLGEGELTKPLTVRAHQFSSSARAKIEAAGGRAILIGAAEQPPADAAAPEDAPADTSGGEAEGETDAGDEG